MSLWAFFQQENEERTYLYIVVLLTYYANFLGYSLFDTAILCTEARWLYNIIILKNFKHPKKYYCLLIAYLITIEVAIVIVLIIIIVIEYLPDTQFTLTAIMVVI